MRGANNKMRPSDIEIVIELYRADRTYLRLSPKSTLSRRVHKGEMADVSL